VTVDLDRLLTNYAGSVYRRARVGTSSLGRLESGDVTALFAHEVMRHTADSNGAVGNETPVSPHYSPLEWHEDSSNLDDEEAIAAESDDWVYHIWPVRAGDGAVIGYRVSGGDYESGDDFGSSLIDGKPGERTLQKAKAAAQANYASRYREADEFLDALLGHLEDEDGPRTRRNGQGRIMCRVDEPGIDEVEVVASLRDGFDDYDAVCVRTLLACGGDGSLLLEAVCDMIRRKVESCSE
jgi:hypothetical protein